MAALMSFRNAANTTIRTFGPSSIVSRSFQRTSPFSTTSRIMAAPQTAAGQVISETAKQEGGPHKGSESAQMQSQVGKVQNFEDAAQQIAHKIETNPGSVTSQDANYVKSREARATGQNQPPKDSISAEAQRLASANEKGTAPAVNSQSNGAQSNGALSPEEQSHLTKERNFQQAAAEVGQKMASNPGSITQEDGNLLHSREQRARGTTEKGGIASQVKQMANENEAK